MTDRQALPLPAMRFEDRAQRNKETLLAALKGIGATSAVVTYIGCGDSGCTESAEAWRNENEKVDIASPVVKLFVEDSDYHDGQWRLRVSECEMPLNEAIKDYAMEQVCQHRPGWENNEGANGVMVFDVGAGSVMLQHKQFYTESEETETAL